MVATTTPFTGAKNIGTARQIFRSVLTILRHGTPNFRRVNVSVPHVMCHQCSQGCRDYLPEVVSARVNEARCQIFGVPRRFFLARVNGVYAIRQVFVVGFGATAKGHFRFWLGGRVTSGRRSESLLITPNAFEPKYSNC